MKSKWEGILASIFYGFLQIFGPKLGLKMQGKSGQDRPRQGKTREDKGREGKEEERKREAGIGKEKGSRGTFSARGGGVHPTFRGRPPLHPGPLVSRMVAASCCDIFAILVPFFFASFFRCLFGSILAPFSFQLGSQNPTKCIKIHFFWI